MKNKLLIVDDDEAIRTQMRWALTADYEVALAGDRETALQAVRSFEPSVVLLDLGLPPAPHTPSEGLAALAEILAYDSHIKVVVITGQGERSVALQAIGSGAHDFLGKPLDTDELKALLKRTFHVATLEKEYSQLQQRYEVDGFEGLIGSDTAMQSVFSSIKKVAGTDAPVLILGESGTGKEMTARAIHQRSDRKKGAFVAINCGAIPENLIESELFGHEKGAFTGAHAMRKGRIETANGGTLFLDEIGELATPLQVKLLRFLQERCIERVGGRQEIPVDVRVVAATNVNIKKGMEAGTFREDLYYRLAVVQLSLPPLRSRGSDLELIAKAFLRQFGEEQDRPSMSFAPNALRALRMHQWPGNIRELQNRVKRAVIMASSNKVTAEDMELGSADPNAKASSLRDARESLERQMVQDALRKHAGKVAAAAVELGISRPTLYELIEKLGIQKPESLQTT